MSILGHCVKVCSCRQWEVIVVVFTLMLCMENLIKILPFNIQAGFLKGCLISQKYSARFDVVIMTFVRCTAILYAYYQLKRLIDSRSRYFVVCAIIFVALSTCIYSSALLALMSSEYADLKDALYFFVMFIDLSTLSRLTHSAFAGVYNGPDAVSNQLYLTMSSLGTRITLDALVEILLISMGTLSSVYRVNVLCGYACLSAVVTYVMTLTLYPALVSLAAEMSLEQDSREEMREERGHSGKSAQKARLYAANLTHSNDINSGWSYVILQMKLITCFALFMVHVIRWQFAQYNVLSFSNFNGANELNCTFLSTEKYVQLFKWLNAGADHIVVLIILLALCVKSWLFESTFMNTEVDIDGNSTTEPNKDKVFDYVDKSFFDYSNKKDDNICSVLNSNLKDKKDYSEMTDAEVLHTLRACGVRSHELEAHVGDFERCVRLRRQYMHVDRFTGHLPVHGLDYSLVHGRCCENVIGFVPVPLGLVGPLLLDGQQTMIPLATTEGALVASTNRGCRAICQGAGVKSMCFADNMTRAPLMECLSLDEAKAVVEWLNMEQNFREVKECFDSTSRFGRLSRIEPRVFGRLVFLRFVAETGDAMGMNMVTKGVGKSIEFICSVFPTIKLISVSSNVCTDKKPSAINWLYGRGKCIVTEAIIPHDVVRCVLKTDVASLVQLNYRKNLIGSSVAGSIGGNNAHAANIVAAIFIATGQDPAQCVTSSMCMTLMDFHDEHLYVSCTMPCLEVGTVGGGTCLTAQKSCLRMLGCDDTGEELVGANSKRLARVICATVLAAEISLLAAQCSGDLVQSHMRLNRKRPSCPPSS